MYRLGFLYCIIDFGNIYFKIKIVILIEILEMDLCYNILDLLCLKVLFLK